MTIKIVPNRSEICRFESSNTQALIKTDINRIVEIKLTPFETQSEKNPQNTTKYESVLKNDSNFILEFINTN